ncbi:hypothetical protein H7Y21_03000 [Arenimonas sp.]|nr:hypothetical protein [Candidatus Parcubacteria bacterium]
MKKNITIILLLLVVIGGGYFLYNQKQNTPDTEKATEEGANIEKMDITVYVNDEAGSSEFLDCAVNKKITIQVPKTEAIADASLKFLFSDELSKYAVYKSVEIASGTAKIMLKSDLTPAGYPIGSLSSCQSQNLLSVLKDTLTQYPGITSVELYSPKQEKRIEF